MTSPFMLSTALITELEKRKLEMILGTEIIDFLDRADTVSLPSWPAFMLNDVVANRYRYSLNDKHADFQFALIDKESQKWIAVGNSIPLHWDRALEELPDEGWDWALTTGMESEKPANLLCALAIQILPEFRGRALSTLMVMIMKEIGYHFGFNQLIAPVRPNKKCEYPLLSMESYIEWTKDGERFDPWLRVHERLGARLLKTCPEAMEIRGSVQDWQSWTKQSFQSSGEYIIPGALTTMTMDIENDTGIYIEPNVWMLHNY